MKDDILDLIDGGFEQSAKITFDHTGEPDCKFPNGEDLDVMLAWMNRNFAVILDGSQAKVVFLRRDLEKPSMLTRDGDSANDPGVREYVFISTQALREWLGHLLGKAEDTEGKVKILPLVSNWLKWAHRNTLSGSTFEPRVSFQSEALEPIQQGGVLNTWTGFAFEPIESTTDRQRKAVETIRTHIHRVLCAGGQSKFERFLDWLAGLVQYPGESNFFVPCIVGGQGAGKSLDHMFA